MKRLFLLLLLILVNTALYSQSGISKSYYLNGNVESEISKVEDVYEGTSYWYYENGNLKEEKTFSNGKLHGWVRYYYPTGLVREEFHVNRGVKEGLHKIYFENGGLKSVLSYEKGVLKKQITLDYDSLYSPPPEAYLAGNRQYEIQKRKDDLLICDSDICPIPIGGLNVIQDSLIYPEHAKLYGLEGIVKLIAEINERGEVVRTRIIEGIGLGCDEEAQRVVKNTKFIPGQTNGEPVLSKLTLQLQFTLSDKPLLAGDYDKSKPKRNILPLERAEVDEQRDETSVKDYPAKSRAEEREEAIVETCNIDLCPKPRGGLEKIIEKLVLPSTAIRIGIEGSVIIDIDVDEFGLVRDTRIIQGLGYGIDEAVEVALFETEFEPGKDKGEYKRTFVRLVVPVMQNKEN